MAIINDEKLPSPFFSVSIKGITVAGATKVYKTITDRDADGEHGLFAFVEDASADPTVGSGFAIYYKKTSGWKKLFEEETMDQNDADTARVQWKNIVGAPTSAVTNIDEAVASKHSHNNKTDLDTLTIANKVLKTGLDTVLAQPNKYTKWLQLVRPLSITTPLHCKIVFYSDPDLMTKTGNIDSRTSLGLFKYFNGSTFASLTNSGIPFDKVVGRFVIVDIADYINSDTVYIKWHWYEPANPNIPVSPGACVYPCITPTNTESVGLTDVGETLNWQTTEIDQ